MRIKQETGRLGELAARRHLESVGCTIMASNVRCGGHEIDIVADDEGTLVFVEVRARRGRMRMPRRCRDEPREVRARRGRMFGAPEESITSSKQRQMLTAAQCYLTANDCWHRLWRIDVVAVKLDRNDGIERVSVIRNAVEG